MDQRIIDLYKAANNVCAEVGAEGEISAQSKEIEVLMDVLRSIDHGAYDPNWKGDIKEPECEHRMMKYKGEPAKCTVCGYTDDKQ